MCTSYDAFVYILLVDMYTNATLEQFRYLHWLECDLNAKSKNVEVERSYRYTQFVQIDCGLRSVSIENQKTRESFEGWKRRPRIKGPGGVLASIGAVVVIEHGCPEIHGPTRHKCVKSAMCAYFRSNRCVVNGINLVKNFDLRENIFDIKLTTESLFVSLNRNHWKNQKDWTNRIQTKHIHKVYAISAKDWGATAAPDTETKVFSH